MWVRWRTAGAAAREAPRRGLADRLGAITDTLNGLGPMLLQPFLIDSAALPTFNQRNPGLGDIQRQIGRGEGFDAVGAFGQLANAGLAAGFAGFGDFFAEGGPGEGLMEEAQQAYPKKTGWEWHHIWPKYIGGPGDGPRVHLPAAYHQWVTNAFRRAWAYGQGIWPNAQELAEIMAQVYGEFPLP